MGDRVAVMKDGVLQQCDKPRVLYDSPVNAFVAGFIGSPSMNLIEGSLEDEGVRIGSSVIPMPRELKGKIEGSSVTVGLRPESVEVVPEGLGIPAIVTIVEELGAEAFVYAEPTEYVNPSLAAVNDIIARVDPRNVPAKGDLIHLRAREGSALFFDSQTGARITLN